MHLVLFTLHARRMNSDLLGMSNSKEKDISQIARTL